VPKKATTADRPGVRIAPGVAGERIPLELIDPHPLNDRIRDAHAEAQLRASLVRHGQYRSTVGRAMPGGRVQMLAGHGTLDQVRELGGTELAVEVHPQLSDEDAAAIVAADNAIAELATYDPLRTVELLRAAGPLEGTGYDPDRMRDLLAGIEPDVAGGNTDPDDAPSVPRVPLSRRGDVWQLGAHRLVCGDATDPADWSLLLDADERGGDIDLVITDPPYGVAYEGGPLGDRTGLVNDDLGAAELGELLAASFGLIADRLIPGRAFYVCSPSGPLEEVFRQSLRAGGLGMRQQLVWVKDRHVLGRQDHHLRHESVLYGWTDGGLPIPVPDTEPDLEQLLAGVYADGHETLLYGWRDGARHEWRGGRRQNSVWEIPRPARSTVHPTMKPVTLYLRAVQNSSVKGDLVADPFAGSGTLVIACEMAGRAGRVLELDPGYVDVIAERWQRFAGHQPELAAVAADGDQDRLGPWDLAALRDEESS
jgi:DNA modification methylase